MKTQYWKSVFITISMVFLSTIIIAQEWQWDWAYNTNDTMGEPQLEILHADAYNNYYYRGRYSDFIQFSDTSFSHSYSYDTYNSAIAKYNTMGEFENAVDFYTSNGNFIFDFEVSTDADMNLYVGGDFTDEVFFQDTFLTHYGVYYAGDLFLVKLNEDFEVVWADIVGGTYGDDLHGIVVSDEDEIYFATSHYASPADPTTVVYLGQDTVVHNAKFNSIVKIDKDKNLIWRKEIIGGGNGSFFMGSDGNLHFSGRLYTYIVIDGDTMHNPYPINEFQPSYILTYNTDGDFIKSGIIEKRIWIQDWEVNTSGNYIVTGFILDTLIVEKDTIIVPPDYKYYIIAQLNQDFEIEWYHLTIEQPYQDFSGFKIQLDLDHIIFSASGNKEIQIADTVLNMGYRNGMIMGELNEQGVLQELITVLSTFEVRYFMEPILDNCKNPIISGIVQGTAAFGNDTVASHWGLLEDAFIAKLLRTEYDQIDIGPDTIACNDYTIMAPDNYLYYSWNDEISNQSQMAVNESGTYFLACSNGDGCWAYDTINVEIQPGFEIDIGADTTIDVNDTLMLSVPDQYESYLWSNAEESHSITIIGNDYGAGTFPVWVEVTQESCIIIDTLILTINDDFGINEMSDKTIKVYPNPFVSVISIQSIPAENEIAIYDLHGSKLFSRVNHQTKSTEHIQLRHLEEGVYFLRITTREGVYTQKIVKL